MSTESHYKSNLRDLFFNLFEVSNLGDEVLGKGGFNTLDETTAKETLTALEAFVQKEMAKSFADSDRVGLTLDDDGTVRLPPSLKESIQAWYEAGWHMLEVKEEYGGFQAPPSVVWAGFELAAGANANACFYQFGTFMARIIDELATEAQRKRYVQPMIDNKWGATMVLTEPDAGSDVGAGRSKAKHIEGDVYELEGVKRFITNGDFDIPDNIVHMVLARPEGAQGGTKGLSLFIVPKFWVNEDGSLGERNGVKVTGIEHKMGIKASATCELTMGGDDIPCRGLLVGEVHDGIRQMFHVIEHARMSIGVKSMSTLSTAYLNALEYAKERVQGADLRQIMDKSAPRVAILQHPDVRRMLINLKAHAEGMRALCFHTSRVQDDIKLLEAEGGSKDDIKALNKYNDLLLPMVKGYCSDRAYPLLADALQVFGGSGYCTDYPIEQYIRDQKIDTLYEGTTHIQALDLLFRKIARDQGATLQVLFGKMQKLLDDNRGGDALKGMRDRLQRGLQDVQGAFMALMGKMGEDLYHVGLQGNRMLYALSELTIGWLLIEHAVVAAEKRETASEADRSFYDGKIASAQFYADNVLPGLTLARKLVESSSLDITELDESAF